MKLQYPIKLNTLRLACLASCGLLFCMLHEKDAWANAAAQDEPAGITRELPSIELLPGDGMNLQIVDHLTPHYVVVKVNPPVHNWFAGTFTNLPTDKEVTIGLSMDDMDMPGNKADVAKWRGLQPLIFYSADYNAYSAYEWFSRDEQGRWVSSDPFKQGKNSRFAGDGAVPEQTVIPQEIAEQFLSPDGKYWQPWREIAGEAVPNVNVFRMRETFALPSAIVSFRIPYTYTYLQAFIERLQTERLPGVFIDELGETTDGRKLQVIRLEDPDATVPAEHATICLIAKEHATEHASSWALQGALNFLLSNSSQAETLRRGRTWLFIPIEDPDGSALSTFDQLTDRFYRSKNPPTPSEVLSYARYFTEYIVSGNSIDVVVSLHNVEANECAHAFNPFRNFAFQDQTIRFNKTFFARLQQEGYRPAPPEQCWNTGAMNFRLFGWLADRFGAFDLCYEVNDRYPQQRLSLAQLQGIGRILDEELVKWTESHEGQRHHRNIHERLTKHREARTQYLENKTGGDGERSSHELLTLGY